MRKHRNGTFAGDVLRLVSGTGAAQLIGILASPILTRLYPVEAFGVTALFIALTGILSVVACLSYEQTIVIADDDREAANLLAVSLCCALLVASLAVLAIWFGGVFILKWDGVAGLAPYLWLVPIAVLIHGVFVALNYWNTRTRHFGRLAIARIISQLSSTSTSLGAGFAGYATGTAMIAANVGGQGVSAAVLGGQIWNDHRRFFANAICRRDMLAALKRHKRFPIYRPWSSLLNAASWQLPVMMLGAFFSPAVVGLYALVFRMLQVPMSLVGKAIGQVFLHRASSEKTSGNLAPLVRDSFQALLAAALLPILILLIVGQDLFRFIFGPNWSEAGVFAQILAPWALVWFVSSPLSSLYYVLEKQRQEVGLQGAIFVTRVASIGMGGVLNEPRLAVILFSVSGIVTYGYLVKMLFDFVGLKTADAFRSCRNIVRDGVIYALPVVVVKLLELGTIVVLLTSILVLSSYFLQQKNVFLRHEKV